MGQCQSKSDKVVQDEINIKPSPKNPSQRNENRGGRTQAPMTDNLLPSKNVRPNEVPIGRKAKSKKDNHVSINDHNQANDANKNKSMKSKKGGQQNKPILNEDNTRNSQKGTNKPRSANNPSNKSNNSISQSSPSRSRRNRSSHPQSSKSPLFPKIKKTKSKKRNASKKRHSPGHSSSNEIHPQVPPEWEILCQHHLHKLIPPIDVTTAIQDRIFSIINLLEPIQIYRIQRRVRHIIRELKSPSSALSSSAEKSDSSSLPSIISVSNATKEKIKLNLYKDKLIDETLFRSIFVGGDGILRRGWQSDRPWIKKSANLQQSENQKDNEEMEMEEKTIIKYLLRPKEGGNVSPERRISTTWRRGNGHDNGSDENWDLTDPLGSAFLILLALAESKWGHVAVAAATEIERGGLQVDETGIVPNVRPRIEAPVVEGAGESVVGVAFSDICFLMAMASKGTRSQKLLLLFHILLPPKQLKLAFSKHTFPTWLLEDSSDIILSLSSLYYHYKTMKNMTLMSIQACDTIAVLLYAAGKNEDSADQHSNTPHENDYQPNNTTYTHSEPYDFIKRKNIESILTSIRNGTFVEPFPHAKKFWESLPPIFNSSPQIWSLDDFISWANDALDNYVLDVIYHRLFGTGILPSFFVERNLVIEKWLRWQRYEKNYWLSEGIINRSFSEDKYVDDAQIPKETKKSLFSKLFNGNGVDNNTNGEFENVGIKNNKTSVWGGLGGVDGRGGFGHGVMYIVEKNWWNVWKKFVGWEEKQTDVSLREDMQDEHEQSSNFPTRPSSISNEYLIDPDCTHPTGSLGSYYELKPNLRKDVDYVLVPPGVWDVLYEAYGGGPPLPRMVVPPTSTSSEVFEESKEEYILKIDDDEESFEIKMDKRGNSDVIYNGHQHVLPVPKSMQVSIYPWVLHCHVCDPYQPYRRGDNGPMSVRIMSDPNQPLWRVFSEILVRLPVHHARVLNSNGKGIARLWKKLDSKESNSTSVTISRYGPWSLLCRNRHAPFSVKRQNGSNMYEDYEEEWIEYTNKLSVESVGLKDRSHIMLEFALISKSDSFIWPREAAAKDGRERRLADEDASFRQYLRGLDSNGKLMKPAPTLVGTIVDAMDSTGRWYQSVISKVELWKPTDIASNEKMDDDTDEDDESSEESSTENMIPGEIFRVRVDFKNSSGYEEWINVSSDRLAVKGRCTVTNLKSLDGNSNGSGTTNASTNLDSKGKLNSSTSISSSSVRKGNTIASSNAIDSDVNGNSSTSICPYPGYGACGLTNLGNTCYANAALQCLGYLPLLRAYLLSNSYKTDLNKDNPLGTGGRVLEEYAELLRILWSGKYSAKAPSKFKQQLGRANSQFAGNDQQDAQELLLAILDSLHEDSNKVRKKPMVPPMEDSWVNKNPIPRVGREAWWRYLRRNKSVITDTAMGQVMNRVTCPICNHSSLNFDPFGILSIPFPSVNDVIFKFTLLRRASTVNCPITCSKRKILLEGREKNETKSSPPSPPSSRSIFEQYAFSMPRLADIADLKLRLQSLTGITANRLKLYTSNQSDSSKEFSDADAKTNPLNSYVQIIPFPDKPGPCFQLAAQLKAGSGTNESPTVILGFESTFNPRQLPEINDELDDASTTSDEESEETPARGSTPRNSTAKRQRQIAYHSKVYGDEKECMEYDTDPLSLSKAMSRHLWPKSDSDFSFGLRVDAIDQRKRWFSGSVVEIMERDKMEKKQNGESIRATREVKIHFDNFSSKWDEHYNIDHFRDKVRPLYSHAVPKHKPMEFMVFHRCTNVPTNEKINDLNLFGHPFTLECHHEWSTARSGAHILAQASRFLQNELIGDKMLVNSTVKFDHDEEKEMTKTDIYHRIATESSIALNEIIRVLIDSDRRHVLSAIGKSSEKESRNKDGEKRSRKRRSSGTPGSFLRKKMAVLLPKLPFEIRVCKFEAGSAQKGNKITEEVIFPFSLVRTFGNFMTAQSSIILDWKNVSELFNTMVGHRKSQSGGHYRSFSYPEYPILYTVPVTVVHKQSRSLLEENSTQNKSFKGKNELGQNKKGSSVKVGMQLADCLDEFCKELHAEGWTCPECKKTREGRQKMTLWHLPDLLTFHIKRFNCNARWREKISTNVNFPLTGLNMKNWCDPKSPQSKVLDDSTVYDLIGVINHYGGMTGGHYVAACKATKCSSDGIEAIVHSFSGAGINAYEIEGETVQTGWRLGRNKDKDLTAVQSKIASEQARTVAESSEPLWLQFDDDLVEPIPPQNVVSETAYVLFYRRRRLSPAHIAKYTTLD